MYYIIYFYRVYQGKQVLMAWMDFRVRWERQGSRVPQESHRLELGEAVGSRGRLVSGATLGLPDRKVTKLLR